MNIQFDPVGTADLVVWAFGTLAIGVCLSKRYTWTVGLAFVATVFSSLRIFQNTLNALPPDPPRMFALTAESALISFLLTIMIAQSVSTKIWIAFFRIIAIINAVAILGDFGYHTINGLLNDETWEVLVSTNPLGSSSTPA